MLNIYKEQREEFIKLSQLSYISKIKRHTLTARMKSLYAEEDLTRSTGNQILLLPQQTRSILQNSLITNKDSKIIYIGNLKGGVGKTTISYLLINTIRLLGLRVCAIDLDVQANLTNQYIKIDEQHPIFYDVIDNRKKIADVVMPLTDNFHIIPSSLRNSLIPKALTMQSPKHHLTWFNSICLDYLRSQYDVIIVDTPPSISTLNSVFCLCLNDNDNIIIPVCADDFSSMGVQMFLDDILDIRKSYDIKSDLTISIIMNRFFQTQKNNLEMLLKISNKYRELLSEVVIKDSAKIREFTNSRLNINQIKSGQEVYEIISLLLQELNILKESNSNVS